MPVMALLQLTVLPRYCSVNDLWVSAVANELLWDSAANFAISPFLLTFCSFSG
jgi:hypothetical protein